MKCFKTSLMGKKNAENKNWIIQVGFKKILIYKKLCS